MTQHTKARHYKSHSDKVGFLIQDYKNAITNNELKLRASWDGTRTFELLAKNEVYRSVISDLKQLIKLPSDRSVGWK